MGTIILSMLGAAGMTLYDRLLRQATEPISIVVETNPSVFEAGEPRWTTYNYFLPVRPAELPRPPEDCRKRRGWAYKQGGADADAESHDTRLLVTLQGRRKAEVSIQNLRVEVMDRKPLRAGTVAACPVGGATGEIRGFEVDLGEGSNSPRVRYVDPDLESPRSSLRLTLDEGESEALDIVATVSGSESVLVKWRLWVDIVADGKRTSKVVDDEGRPFRTAGTGSGVPYMQWQGGKWVPLDVRP